MIYVYECIYIVRAYKFILIYIEPKRKKESIQVKNDDKICWMSVLATKYCTNKEFPVFCLHLLC